MSGWGGAPVDDRLKQELVTVVQTALSNAVGVEGGIWQADAGSLAHAFPSYEGTGPKTDLPAAEENTIREVNAEALRSGRPAVIRQTGRSQVLLVQACPLRGPLPGTTAWTMTRTFTAEGPAYTQLLAGLAVLVLTIFGSALWLARVLFSWSLAIGFGSSDSLAAAYGIAVSATMLATTMLLSIAMREVWNWPLWTALTVGGVFGIVEGAFLSANLLKFTEGGWVPLLLGVLIYAVMRIWQMGIAAMQRQADEMQIPIDDIVAQITSGDVSRVSGTAIFVARVTRDIPPLVFWHLRHIRSLHDCIFIVTVVTELIPYVAEENRTEVREIAPQVWRVHAHYGFMEQPDLPALLDLARDRGYPVDPSKVTCLIGRETIVRREDGRGLPWFIVTIVSFLVPNLSEAVDYFRLPRDEVVEIGRQFAI